jgi:UDP-N-acetylglucosamine 4,6-dehydratase
MLDEMMSYIKKLSKTNKIFIMMTADIIIVFVCWLIFGPPLTVYLASNFEINLIDIISINIWNFIFPYIIFLSFFILTGFYRTSIGFSDSRHLISRSLIGSLVFGLSWGVFYLAQFEVMRTNYAFSVLIKSILLAFIIYGSIQIVRDIARITVYPNKVRKNGKPVLIYGAGAAGNELYHALKNDFGINIIGFFDTSIALNGSEINNIKIYGKDKEIKKLSKQYKNLEVYLAIPSLSSSKRRKIISNLERYKVAVRSIPSLHEIVADQKAMTEMQDLSIDDILPRVRVKKSPISFEGQSIMITGAGGSIGSEIVRQLLNGNPKKIVLYEISEINLYSIQSEVDAIKKTKENNTHVVGLLGDVKNEQRVKEVVTSHQIDTIYHAAAYKHVPIVEYFENITEGVRNNILGTQVICDVADECHVNKVVVISSDKAVRPTNIMGASKRLAEMVVQSKNATSANTKFCMVRFGNVINSSGSVIPLFRKQIAAGGPLTITHKEVTRFFMTISEASSLVIQAGEFATGGDVFILDMGEQVKIFDLAEKLVYLSGRNISNDEDSDGIYIKEIGLRPGEKLYEELLISGEELRTPNSKIFKSIENFPENDELIIIIKQLKEKIRLNDVIGIKDILKVHVEGFKEEANHE